MGLIPSTLLGKDHRLSYVHTPKVLIINLCQFSTLDLLRQKGPLALLSSYLPESSGVAMK